MFRGRQKSRGDSGGQKAGSSTPRSVLERVKGDSPIPGGTSPVIKWARALAVAIEQCQARTKSIGGTANSSKAKGLKMTPVAKSDADISTIASFAENLWMKHDMARMMEGTNKELAEQIKDDMRVFVTEAQARGESPTLAEWAKVSIWAADTGGARDASGSAIRAQRGLWKTLFEQVRTLACCRLPPAVCFLLQQRVNIILAVLIRNLLLFQVLAQDTDQANFVRALEMVYADNIAGGEPKMVRSLCYDMGHVFNDEQVCTVQRSPLVADDFFLSLLSSSFR